MGKKKHHQESEKIEKPPKKYKFYLGSKERYIIISSDFDSGNISLIRQISEFQVHHAYLSTGWLAFVMALTLIIKLTLKVGFIFPSLASQQTPEESFLSPKFKLFYLFTM